MHILISNDDGINAIGIKTLNEAVKKFSQTTVVAPEGEQSAVGHAITITDPLRVREHHENGSLYGYAIDGTPADCVKIALKAIMKDMPDLVVSGINQGANIASNIIYSGTVSAATEGTILGVPSIAFSMNSFVNKDFSRAVDISCTIIKKTAEKGLPKGTLLNVNLPAPEADYKGIKICHQSNNIFYVDFEKRHDPRGLDYYWQGGKMDLDDKNKDSDVNALQNGYATITPIKYELTNNELIDELKSWEF